MARYLKPSVAQTFLSMRFRVAPGGVADDGAIAGGIESGGSLTYGYFNSSTRRMISSARTV